MGSETGSYGSQPEGRYRHDAWRTLWREFQKPEWQSLDRLKSLSGLGKEEILRLPKNTVPARIFTGLLRAWQKDVRSHDIEGGSPINLSEVKTADDQKLNQGEVIMTGPRNYDTRVFDEMINPFNPEGEKIFPTEYAQLVNLAARKALAEGKINNPLDVVKLTILAAIQIPVSFVWDQTDLSIKQKKLPFSDEYVRGKRFENETSFLDEENVLFTIPLTEERIRDPGFVQAINFKVILRSKYLKDAARGAFRRFK